MRASAIRFIRRVALVAAGTALCAGVAHAQTPPDTIRRPPVRDSLQRDSLRVSVPIPADSATRAQAIAAREQSRIDSIRAARMVDTIKAPLARFESPPDLEINSRLRLDKQEILSSGAHYLSDLLDRVPGVTSFRSGWLAGLHTAAYRGDFGRIRIFVDGIEFDAIGPRNGGVVDHVEIPLWLLDAIEIERTPSEIRVWARTTTVTRTTPYSRVDIFTGDLNTNAFRGQFQRRFANGFALQVAGQQLSTQRGRIQLETGNTSSEAAGDGDQQLYNLRLGWARRRWSIDAYGTASTHRRDRIVAGEGNASLPKYQGTRRDGYLRLAYGDTASGPWAQAMLSSVRARLDGVPTDAPPEEGSAVDSVRSDTVRTRAQTLLGVGWRARNFSISAVDRIRGIEGSYEHSPAARATFSSSLLTVGAYAERSSIDTTTRTDVYARITPTAWSSIMLTQSARMPGDSTIHQYENATRAEAALRLAGRWIGGGVLRHDNSSALSPRLLGAQPVDLVVPASTGLTAFARGRLYRDLGVDVQVVRWDAAAFARPQMQVFTELRLASQWLSKFPKGEFSIDARIRHELRDPVSFCYSACDGDAVIRTTERTQLVNASLEIRIQQATLFYQYRNLTGAAYSQLPGIVMPPAVQLYGVRWEFWN